MRNSSGSALELEDFVLEEKLIAAANVNLTKWHPKAEQIAGLEGEDGTRMVKLERAFEKKAGVQLPKIDLAYSLLELLDIDPGAKLLDPRRSDAVRIIATSMINHFQHKD
jgi:hypothetical protein